VWVYERVGVGVSPLIPGGLPLQYPKDNAAVKVEWVSKYPYYPQWQLVDDPELVASLGTDIHKIEVYDKHF
jgi:hypothetical protein